MAPPSIDFGDDIDIPAATNKNMPQTQRTLLLAPPSIASHPSALTAISEAYDRSSTDIQMLDRLALGLVSLPSSTYDLVLLLTDADGSRTESQRTFSREVVAKVLQALKPRGKLRSQDGSYPVNGSEKTEAILAGLVSAAGADGVEKPADTGSQSVPLRFGKKSDSNNAGREAINGKRKSIDQPASAAPAGVGFIDDLDDLEDDDDEELIDENDILTEEDKQRPVMPREYSLAEMQPAAFSNI